ncbi:MAG: molybdenum cofactor guanylyltransferase [Elusimicrobiota bacterium]
MKEFTGVILAGGRSRRFGSQKALAPWGEETVIETLAHTLCSLTPHVMVVGKEKWKLAGLKKIRIIEDHFQDFHALGGIVTALREAPTNKVFIVSCDIPLLEINLIELLLKNCSESLATIPIWDQNIQPLCGLYSKKILPFLEQALTNNHHKLQEILTALHVQFVPEIELKHNGVTRWSFFDLDTQEEYEYAKNNFKKEIISSR